MKLFLCLPALLATACAVENQMKVEVEAKPLVPYMMATSRQLSEYYTMLYNPFSFIGYTNPQVEMFPHQLSVMKAISGKGTRPMASNLYPGVGVNAHVGGMYQRVHGRFALRRCRHWRQHGLQPCHEPLQPSLRSATTRVSMDRNGFRRSTRTEASADATRGAFGQKVQERKN